MTLQPPHPISLERAQRIVAEVAAQHVVDPAVLTARGRPAHIVAARSEAAWRIWSETDLRVRQIADVLGVKDHSSVLYLIRRHELRAGR